MSHFSCSVTIVVMLTSHITGEMANSVVLKPFRLQFVTRKIFQYVQWGGEPSPLPPVRTPLVL